MKTKADFEKLLRYVRCDNGPAECLYENFLQEMERNTYDLDEMSWEDYRDEYNTPPDECLNYSFSIIKKGEQLYLQAEYQEFDFSKDHRSWQKTRKWYLSPHMTDSEFYQTCFKCVLTSMEHRAREMFKYRGKRVFGPHFNIDALHSICGQLDYRKPKEQVGNGDVLVYAEDL